ncbi:hypothetical protein [Tenacibaculum singaporense]|uniref:hypothetical protein n=1 Tax=Tenacibaculum singaporense TaxID=2358479 RepID=UPI003518E5EE
MEQLIARVKEIVNLCWGSFSAKVGGDLLSINKEASMQLHFAYILKNSMDLVIHHSNESVSIELEKGILVNQRMRECDIIIRIKKDEEEVILPIEMKCYKTISSSGKLRGAQDLFRYGIYEDLELLESYANKNENRLLGIQLTMTDNRNFVYPKSKKGKSWNYDVSHDTVIKNGIEINIPIGGKEASVKLIHDYHFNWVTKGEFYFLKLEAL